MVEIWAVKVLETSSDFMRVVTWVILMFPAVDFLGRQEGEGKGRENAVIDMSSSGRHKGSPNPGYHTASLSRGCAQWWNT